MRCLAGLAWREAGARKQRLLLCTLSMVFGVAALTAILSFGDNMRRTIDDEALSLLGADLQITSRTPFSDRALRFIDSLGGQQARETRFSSMAVIDGNTRLVQVRALQGAFPFHGKMVTRPEAVEWRDSDQPVALVDASLARQFGIEIGDSMKLGASTFTVRGEIEQVPGEAAFAGIFAPRVYIPMRHLEQSGLIGQGTIAFHRIYLHFPGGFDPRILQGEAEALFADEGITHITVEDRKEEMGDALANLYRYLGLVGFVALLLGGLGIAAAVQVYLTDKVAIVAILRCLGASPGEAFAVFFLQILGASFAGAAAGVALGVCAQWALPLVLAPFIPFEIAYSISGYSLALGFAFGTGIAILFAASPLLHLRRISPLRALRVDFSGPMRMDPLKPVIWLLLAAVLLGYIFSQTETWWHGVIFSGSLTGALILLAACAWLLRMLLRKLTSRKLPFTLYQGVANLYRPRNRSTLLVVILGMGAFLIFTLYLVETGLLQQSAFADRDDEPNLLFFDIQSDQLDDFRQILDDAGTPVIESAPVVTMRLLRVKDRSVEDLRRDPQQPVDQWILNREWRSTYRATIGNAERLIDGELIPHWNLADGPIPITLESGMAENLGVGLGDSLRFDVQGIPVNATIAGLREVDWTRLRPNFFAVFPEGVLEGAPTWWMAVTRAGDAATAGALQSEVVRAHSNIIAVDLGVILGSLKTLLDQVAFAIRFMALFTILTGVAVLSVAIATSRYQRISESVLLRTLGASAAQIRRIMAVEYLTVGLLAGFTGVLLAVVGGSILGKWVFSVQFLIPWSAAVGTVAAVGCLTLIIGLAQSRGIVNHPPLATLRKE